MRYRETSPKLGIFILALSLLTFTASAGTPESWGIFDGKLDSILNTTDETATGQRAGLNKLIALHRENIEKRISQAASSIEKQVEELKENLEKDDLHKALTAAIRAKGYSTEPNKFVKAAIIQKLVDKVETAAAKAEKENNWIEALNLYSRLDLLFDSQNLYKKEIKRTGRRVGIIRMYNPEHLYELLVENAKIHGDDKPEPWDFDENRWNNRLRDINFAMLRDSLTLAALRHVESATYEQLMMGGLESLEVFIETDAIHTTFKGLADDAKRQEMLDFLKDLRIKVLAREVTMSSLESSKTLREILNKNSQTIELPESVLIYEFAAGSMDTLDDYSGVVWPAQKERLERTTTGKFYGVGIQISLVNRQLTVVTPLEDTPAHRAGIKAGDKIVSVDGKSTLGIDLNSAVEKITGEEGTEVVLGIKSAGDKKARDIKLIRSEIPIRTIKGWERKPGGEWNYYVDEQSQIGFIRMTQFGPTTVDDMDKAVTQMRSTKGLKGLIIDLRFNPGGLLSAAVDICNRFINRGIIVSTTGPIHIKPQAFFADEEHTYGEFPVVILINKGSASASEILSGCLQSHNRALIVGNRTFGKGSVQNIFGLSSRQAYFKLTTQYYKIPNGRIIHRRPNKSTWGIDPDINVKVSEQQYADLLEARTLLDILKNENEKVDPDAILRKRDKDEDGEVEEKPKAKNADDILKLGLDPQLEVALILIKKRILDSE